MKYWDYRHRFWDKFIEIPMCNAGEQKLEFDTMKLPSGMYFVQFSAGDFHEMKKVIKN